MIRSYEIDDRVTNTCGYFNESNSSIAQVLMSYLFKFYISPSVMFFLPN